jgi:hypothetical protein
MLIRQIKILTTYIIMKKNLLSIIALLIAQTSFAQWADLGTNIYNTNAGNVGIGTTDPQFNLEINAALPFLKLRSSVYTVDPTVLTVKGGIIFNQQNLDKTAAILEAVPPNYHVPGILFATKTSWDRPGPGSTDWYYRMFIHPNGNIGIGTTTPDALLAVNGTIHSKEVRVDMNILPDYVFKPGYDLLTLDEVQKYIDKNQHLPGVPSAEQTEKEGLKLGEMNAILLKKVEELTLYLLEKDEQLKSDRKDISELKKQVEKLTQQQQKKAAAILMQTVPLVD